MKQNTDAECYLGPLLTDPGRIRREAVHKRKVFDEKSVSAEAIPEHQANGWQIDWKLTRVTKVKREKEIDERIENRFWMLLFKLGYPEINEGRDFTILIERRGAEPRRAILQSNHPARHDFKRYPRFLRKMFVGYEAAHACSKALVSLALVCMSETTS